MEKWALIIDGVVQELTFENPADRYHHSLLWIACGQEVEQGWRYSSESGIFTSPPQQDEE